MKRVRGVDEIVTAAATLKPTTANATTTSNNALSVVGGNLSGALEFHANSAINVGLVAGQPLRQLNSKDMPGSIQFGTTQTQQQYTGAIVVPTAAPSPIKVCFIEIMRVLFFY